MSFRLLIIISFLFVSACNKSNKEEGSRTSNGGTAIFGSLYIAPECGYGAATVAVAPPNSAGAITQATVGNGGSFDFQLAAGTYTVSAQAGNCVLQPTQVPTVANRACPYTICLAQSSGCPQAQQTYNAGCGATTTGGNLAYTGVNTGLCTYGTYGCANGSYYPGGGYTGYGKPYLYLTAATETEFEIDIKFLDGSNALASTPSLGMSGWKGKVGPDGKITINNVVYPYLDYHVQAEHKGQQFTSGWCSSRKLVADEMYNYLKKNGYSAKPLEDFKNAVVTEKLPPQEKICVYPQKKAEIATILSLQTNVDLEILRIWFTLVPQNDAAVLKIKPIPAMIASAFEKPRTDAIEDLKTSGPLIATVKADEKLIKKADRQIANRPVVKAEEWGVGFFLEK